MELLWDLTTYIFTAVFIFCMILGLIDNDDNRHNYGHHDGRPGSFYEISNRKDEI